MRPEGKRTLLIQRLSLRECSREAMVDEEPPHYLYITYATRPELSGVRAISLGGAAPSTGPVRPSKSNHAPVWRLIRQENISTYSGCD